MECKCGTHFCVVCGQRYSNENNKIRDTCGHFAKPEYELNEDDMKKRDPERW